MSLLQNTHTLLNDKASIHPREREYGATYRAYAFGQFRLYCQDKPIKETMWRRNKVKALLKWFLLNPGKLCSADEFIDLFWSDLPSETAFGNLYVTIHCLRHLLEPSLGSREASHFIRRQSNNFYWFHMDETWWTDIADVQHLFETARAYDTRGEEVKASFYYRKIISHGVLGFLPEDAEEEWLRPYRQHYEYIYQQVLMRLIQLYQQRNEFEEVLEYAYQALSLDPYCEPATKAIIDVYFRQGNTGMAIRKLDDFSSFLQQELGVEPSREMHSLRAKILETDSL
ncbi:AfsR/SARP family transcriptional regulator [Dictyobacter formicarum]|nr:BTAD domain-containing putative transcriptional regulator [Dictyobacter formicarum]